jgi:hypothetical protein
LKYSSAPLSDEAGQVRDRSSAVHRARELRSPLGRGHLILVRRGHLPALDHGVMDPTPARYAIRIHGHLGATVLSAFPALMSRRHGADTVLTGLLDRSALYGVLAEIEALGLDLVEVRCLTAQRKSPESDDRRSL